MGCGRIEVKGKKCMGNGAFGGDGRKMGWTEGSGGGGIGVS